MKSRSNLSFSGGLSSPRSFNDPRLVRGLANHPKHNVKVIKQQALQIKSKPMKKKLASTQKAINETIAQKIDKTPFIKKHAKKLAIALGSLLGLIVVIKLLTKSKPKKAFFKKRKF